MLGHVIYVAKIYTNVKYQKPITALCNQFDGYTVNGVNSIWIPLKLAEV